MVVIKCRVRELLFIFVVVYTNTINKQFSAFINKLFANDICVVALDQRQTTYGSGPDPARRFILSGL